MTSDLEGWAPAAWSCGPVPAEWLTIGHGNNGRDRHRSGAGAAGGAAAAGPLVSPIANGRQHGSVAEGHIVRIVVGPPATRR